MSRKSDVNTIIAVAKEQYEIVRKGYDRALREQPLDFRVQVKNLMENLRSSLDYMAHDIYEACGEFLYGELFLYTNECPYKESRPGMKPSASHLSPLRFVAMLEIQRTML